MWAPPVGHTRACLLTSLTPTCGPLWLTPSRSRPPLISGSLPSLLSPRAPRNKPRVRRARTADLTRRLRMVGQSCADFVGVGGYKSQPCRARSPFLHFASSPSSITPGASESQAPPRVHPSTSSLGSERTTRELRRRVGNL
jgi:hypothetical protein